MIPLKRVSEMFADLTGHSLSEATVIAHLKKSHKQLGPYEEQIRQNLLNADVLHADEPAFTSMANSDGCTPSLMWTGRSRRFTKTGAPSLLMPSVCCRLTRAFKCMTATGRILKKNTRSSMPYAMRTYCGNAKESPIMIITSGPCR